MKAVKNLEIITKNESELGQFKNQDKTKNSIKLAFLLPTKEYQNYDYSDFCQLFQSIMKELDKDTDIFIFYSDYWKESPMSKKELEDYLNKLNEYIRKTNKELLVIPGSIFYEEKECLFSLTPIIYRDQALLYYMQTRWKDQFDLGEKLNLTACNGNQKGIFIWKGWKIGIEKCRDHGMGKLKEHCEPVDLHLILASGLGGIYWRNVCVTQGYVVFYDNLKNGKNSIEVIKVSKVDPDILNPKFTAKKVKLVIKDKVAYATIKK